MPIDPNIPCTEEGRQSQSWVECPPGSGKPARRTVLCNDPTSPVYTKDVEDAVNTPVNQTINYPTANNEIEITIPKEAKRFAIKSAKGLRWQFSYIVSESGSNFWDIGYGGSYQESGLCLGVDLKIYARADKAGHFKLRYWT